MDLNKPFGATLKNFPKKQDCFQQSKDKYSPKVLIIFYSGTYLYRWCDDNTIIVIK